MVNGFDENEVLKKLKTAAGKMRTNAIDVLSGNYFLVDTAATVISGLKEQLEQVNGAYKTAAERADKAESQVHALKKANRELEQEFTRAAHKVGEMEKEIAELRRKLAAALPKADISAQIARALEAYRVDHGQPAEQIVMTSSAWEMFKAEKVGVYCQKGGIDVPGYWEFMGVPIAILDTNSNPRFVLFGGAEKHDIEW